MPGETTLETEALLSSPAWLPLEDSARGLLLLRLDEDAYRAASFLDQRLLALPLPRATCSAQVLAAAAAQLAPRAHYIFHLGHVGSTLISRLLGAHAALFALREPALLRPLAAAGGADAARLAVVLALLSRTWRPEQRALIKATSLVSELAATMLAGPDRPGAICMLAQPLAYLCTILAGANSRLETGQLAAARLARLTRRLGQSDSWPQPRSEGETIAMSWLCEMITLQQSAAQHVQQVLWADFDVFLAAPAAALTAMLRHLGAAPTAAEIDALVRGTLMRQYSKAPQHAYDAQLRSSLLSEAGHQHGEEIRGGMAWLQRVAARAPQAAAALEQALRAREIR